MRKDIFRRIQLAVLAMAAAQGVMAQNINGTWNGKLDVGGQSINLVFHFGNETTMDSPDQGAYGMPTTVNLLSADSVSVEQQHLAATFCGKLKGETIEGTFSQAGYSFPLSLRKGDVERNRPQEPKPPFAYTTEEITFSNPDKRGGGKNAATLSGTLTLPKGFKKGSPVVLMITGSGQQDRNEELMGHKPFLVIADFLARHGIASLRYDDRGTAKSTGSMDNADTQTLADDAEAGADALRNSQRFGRIGILGHSEGGTIAYALAARGKADFVVSLAGPALRGDSILVMQNHDMFSRMGVPAKPTDDYCTVLSRVLRYKTGAAQLPKSKFGGGMSFLAKSPEAVLVMMSNGIELEPQLRQNMIEVIKTDEPWFVSWLGHDPADDVRHTLCPVMAVGGGNDVQVRADANISATKRLLAEAGKQRGKAAAKDLLKVYPTLNHLFQPSKTGLPMEYATIDTTISEEVLNDIANWINGL